MKKIKDVPEFIEMTKEYQIQNPYRQVQSDISNNSHAKEFIKYLCDISDVIFCDELYSFKRNRTEKTYQEIIEMIKPENVSKTGIKINHYPMFKIFDHEKWEGGYIEGFIRIYGHTDYFIRTYSKMNNLEKLLKKFKNKLINYY